MVISREARIAKAQRLSRAWKLKAPWYHKRMANRKIKAFSKQRILSEYRAKRTIKPRGRKRKAPFSLVGRRVYGGRKAGWYRYGAKKRKVSDLTMKVLNAV